MTAPPWIQRTFDAPGLTQYPVGRHLPQVQRRYGGAVVICLDVSGSMDGHPLEQAVHGCRRFVDQALEARYQVAAVFWESEVSGWTPLTRDRRQVTKFLGRAAAGGGNDVVPALRLAHDLLRSQGGDRVVAIFGDGDLGDAAAAMRAADRLQGDDIRILTCGLGQASAESLDVISTESDGVPRVAHPTDIADAIAGMAAGLRRRPSR